MEIVPNSMDQLTKLFDTLELSKKLKKGDYEILMKESSKLFKELEGPEKCEATTKSGKRCSHAAKDGSPYCKRHMDYVKGSEEGSKGTECVCSAVLKNGPCKNTTTKPKPLGAKNHYCYQHITKWENYEVAK